MTAEPAPLVGIIMGSKSDWDTLCHADEMLTRFGLPHECRIVSAHRTPDWMRDYAQAAAGRGLEVIIAGAGGAAHLPGMVAAYTILPVLGVPVESHALKGLDSLLSIVQMPGGVPVATLAIGKAGATNAALLAVSILRLRGPNCGRNSASSAANSNSACWERRCRDASDLARRHDRCVGQRAARTDVRHRRPPDGLSGPHVLARRRHPHRSGRRPRAARRL